MVKKQSSLPAVFSQRDIIEKMGIKEVPFDQVVSDPIKAASSVVDGLTPEQRFFISWAQIWKSNQTEQYSKMLISIDPHSPNRFRATIPVYNHPDFEKVFSPDGTNGGNNGGRKKIGLW